MSAPPLFDGPGPRLFFAPPGADFSAVLARGLRARLAAHPPEAMARVRLYLNTRRTGRALHAALEDAPASYLPRIAYVGELAEEAADAALPAWTSKLRRTLSLMRLTEAFLAANPGFGPQSSASGLALSLRALLDELQASGIEAEALRRLDLEAHASHWTLTAEFLRIIAEIWPRHLAEAEGGALDPEARRRAAAAARIALWEAAPPAHPVIAAGSTGSTPATADLLAAVAGLPQGAVILPGWDPEMPGDVWEALIAGEAPEHPHHHLAQLVHRLGLGPGDPVPWLEGEGAPVPARLRFLAQALRPAPVTDAWRAALPGLAAAAPEAFAGLTLVEAPTPREEAAAIAAALVGAAREGRTAALVTPDNVLSRRVTAALARWRITPDDSAGRPLGLTPPGVLLGLAAGRVGRPMTAEALAALLRHPLAGGADEARKAHLRNARKLERDALRGGAQEIDWDRLARRLAETEIARAARAHREPRPDPEFDAWLGWLRGVLAPLAAPARSAAEALARQVSAAEALSLGHAHAEAAPAPLWQEAEGADARAFVEGLAEAAPAHGEALAEGGWGALWTALIQPEVSRRPAQEADPRIRILGALEARAETAEVMVLGGLNEGAWPAHPAPDPWLSRDMRATLGLAPPERRIGLAAHDFLQAAAAPGAILTRSARDDGGPAVASRWWVRLENLARGADEDALKAARARGDALLRAAHDLDHHPDIPAAPRPEPRPPVDARPRRLSVTRIETLIRDPYAIYAQYVLGLSGLDPIGRAPGALDKGIAVHAVMERFHADTAGWPAARNTEAALRAAFLAAAETELAETAPWPALRRLWMHRMTRAADWFARGEAARRAEGEPRAVEASGRRVLSGLPGGDFTLSAKADRIDALHGGGWAIYDYKTGAPPSERQIAAFAKQLLLEGAIVEDGGFPDLPAGPAVRLEYLGITGAGEEGGVTSAPKLADHPIAEVWERFAALIAAYDDPAQGYAARLRPSHITWAGDYDHLSRHGEWADEGAEE